MKSEICQKITQATSNPNFVLEQGGMDWWKQLDCHHKFKIGLAIHKFLALLCVICWWESSKIEETQKEEVVSRSKQKLESSSKPEQPQKIRMWTWKTMRRAHKTEIHISSILTYTLHFYTLRVSVYSSGAFTNTIYTEAFRHSLNCQHQSTATPWSYSTNWQISPTKIRSRNTSTRNTFKGNSTTKHNWLAPVWTSNFNIWPFWRIKKETLTFISEISTLQNGSGCVLHVEDFRWGVLCVKKYIRSTFAPTANGRKLCQLHSTGSCQ